MLNTTDSIYPYVVPVEYPVAGEDPSLCHVGIVDINSAKTTWMNIPGDQFSIIFHVWNGQPVRTRSY